MSCKAAMKSFFKISVYKYYVVGIKTVVIYVVVAIKSIKRRVFSLHAVCKIFSALDWNWIEFFWRRKTLSQWIFITNFALSTLMFWLHNTSEFIYMVIFRRWAQQNVLFEAIFFFIGYSQKFFTPCPECQKLAFYWTLPTTQF